MSSLSLYSSFLSFFLFPVLNQCQSCFNHWFSETLTLSFSRTYSKTHADTNMHNWLKTVQIAKHVISWSSVYDSVIDNHYISSEKKQLSIYVYICTVYEYTLCVCVCLSRVWGGRLGCHIHISLISHVPSLSTHIVHYMAHVAHWKICLCVSVCVCMCVCICVCEIVEFQLCVFNLSV